jgi:hypothetical protein
VLEGWGFAGVLGEMEAIRVRLRRAIGRRRVDSSMVIVWVDIAICTAEVFPDSRVDHQPNPNTSSRPFAFTLAVETAAKG